jgi:WD40 repeat protein
VGNYSTVVSHFQISIHPIIHIYSSIPSVRAVWIHRIVVQKMSGNYLALSFGTAVELRDVDNKFEVVKVLRVVPEFGPAVRSACFSHCGTKMALLAFHLASSAPNPVFIFDVETTDQIAEIGGENDCIKAAEFNYAGDRLLTRNFGGDINLWELRSGLRLFTIKGSTHDLVFPPLCFSVDGQYIIASADAEEEPADGSRRHCYVVVYDANSGDTIKSLEGHCDSIRGIAANPAGSTFASSSNDHSVIVWDLSTGSFQHRFILPSIASTICYFPDGTKLAIPQSRHISVVSMASWETLYSIPADDTSRVYLMSIHPDGTRIAWTDWDKAGRFVYDIADNAIVFSSSNVISANTTAGACTFSHNNLVLM